MKEMTKKLNERISNLPTEVYNAWMYTLIGILVLQIDSLHCKYLNYFYGTPDYYVEHMRGWIAIGISIIFGIVDIIITKKIIENAKKIHCYIDIIILNGIPCKIRIEGKTKILEYIAYYYWLVSIMSLIYDVYEILFIHLIKIGPF